VEAEGLRAFIVDRHTQHVGGQEVARELDACVLEPERTRQCLRERRLADSRDVLDQQVAAGQQTGHGQAQGFLLANDDTSQLRQHEIEAGGARGACLRCGAKSHGLVGVG